MLSDSSRSLVRAAHTQSTGRDKFHLEWLEPQLTSESAADVQATLLALSARTIADALRMSQPGTCRLIACGGGVHNTALMEAIADALPECSVESSMRHGLDPDFVEAMGFAWLAREKLAGVRSTPSVRGARGRGYGAIYAGGRDLCSLPVAGVCSAALRRRSGH